MQDCEQCSVETAFKNVTKIEQTQPGICPGTYILPKAAESEVRNFERKMKSGTGGYMVIRGPRGQGKSALLNYIRSTSVSKCGVCSSVILLSEDMIRPSNFLQQIYDEILRRLTFPEINLPLYETDMSKQCLTRDGVRRQKIYDLLESRTTYNLWTNFGNAFKALFSADQNKQILGAKWFFDHLEAQEKKIISVRTKSISDEPKALSNLLHLLKKLSLDLGYSGFLFAIDEVESLGRIPKGRSLKIMVMMKDLVNNINSDPDFSERFHLIYAVSDEWLSTGKIRLATEKVPRVPSHKYTTPINLDTAFYQRIEEAPKIGTETTLEEVKEIIKVGTKCYFKAHPELTKSINFENLYRNATLDETQLIPRFVLHNAFEELKK
nr:hypothetical protein [Candidatus Freyarchaeota archaeon]